MAQESERRRELKQLLEEITHALEGMEPEERARREAELCRKLETALTAVKQGYGNEN